MKTPLHSLSMKIVFHDKMDLRLFMLRFFSQENMKKEIKLRIQPVFTCSKLTVAKHPECCLLFPLERGFKPSRSSVFGLINVYC